MSLRHACLVLPLCAPSGAWAFEAQEPATPPPSTGDHPALMVAAPVGPEAGTLEAQGGVGAAGAPLVVTVADSGNADTACALCAVSDLRLAGQYGLTDRFAIGAVVPLHPWVQGDGGGAPAVGDLTLWAPITLHRGAPWSAAVRPFLALPTGDADRYLGRGTLGAGALLTGGWQQGPLRAAAEVGVDAAGRDVLGAVVLPTGLALHGDVGPGLALGGELRGRITPAADLPPSQELLGSARLRIGPWVLRAAGGRGLTSAPGAAAWRARLDLAWSPPPPTTAPEPVLVTADYLLVDPEGTPLRNAVVYDDGAVTARSDYLGRLTLSEDQVARGADVEAPGYVTTALPPAGEAGPVEVTVPWRPLPVEVRVVDARGRTLDATVSVEGDAPAPPERVDAVGTYTWDLPPGLWVLTTTAEGHTTERRTLWIEAGRTEPLRVDAVLAPNGGTRQAVVTVTDSDGDPVEGAFVQLGDAILGTTGSGGDLTVEGLNSGTRTLAVRHPAYEEPEPQSVRLGVDTAHAVVILQPLPGTVEVRVEGPDGTPTPATVALTGPDASLRPVDTGPDGRHEWILGEGHWTLDVQAPGLGRQVRRIVVDQSERSLRVVEVRLQPEVGPASLTVRAIDANGLAVPGATVTLDGAPLGRTGSDGGLEVHGLAAGPARLEVRADRVRPYGLDLELVEAGREVDVLLDWLPGTVRVRALGPDGLPVAGEIRATDGERSVAGVLDIDGRWVDQLPPGEWQVLVSVAQLGLQTRTFRVEADRTTLLTVDFRLAEVAGSASLALTLERPDGTRVEGARLLIDDQDYGTTGSGGEVRLASLARGARRVRVEADGLQPLEQTLELGDREVVRTLVLPWAEGVVDLTVVQGEAPVTDAVLRLAGPSVLPPVGTDAEGQARLALSPGRWTLLVSSVQAGLHQQIIEVPGGTEPTALRIVIERVGTSTLLVRIQDEDGNPVAGATVALAPGPSELTSPGGAALLTALLPGSARLSVDAPDPLIDRELPLEVPDGSQQLTVQVRWPRETVHVTTVQADGTPVVADLLLQGASTLPVQRTDAQGQATLDLRPGSWRAWGRAGALEGAERFEVTLDTPVDLALELVADELEHQTGRFRFDEAVLFGVGSAELRPEASPALDALAARIRDDASILLAEVQGHTDDTGPISVNLPLSEARARNVLEALVARGVPVERLRARGYAMLRPMVPGSTSEARAQNRRVEIVVIERAVR